MNGGARLRQVCLTPATIITKIVADAPDYNVANPDYGFQGDPQHPIAGSTTATSSTPPSTEGHPAGHDDGGGNPQVENAPTGVIDSKDPKTPEDT